MGVSEVDLSGQLDEVCERLFGMELALERLTDRVTQLEINRPTWDEINGLADCLTTMGHVATNVRAMMCVNVKPSSCVDQPA